ASSSRRFASAFAASRSSRAFSRLVTAASRSARRLATSGSSSDAWARNLFKRFCFACCAAFWRSDQLGSLKPLIERALSPFRLVACVRRARPNGHAFGEDVQRGGRGRQPLSAGGTTVIRGVGGAATLLASP